MLILNFSHPLREEVVQSIEEETGSKVTAVREIPVQFDHDIPFEDQVKQLLDSGTAGLSSREWQTEDILVVPPAHSIIALALMAELDGRMGRLPAVIRLKPETGSLPTRFVFAEIIDLHQMRDRSRRSR